MGKGVRTLCGAALILFILLLHASTTYASGVWTSGSFTFGERKEQVSTLDNRNCQNQRVTVVGASSIPEVASLCVYDRPSFRYAAYGKTVNQGWSSFSEQYFVVGIGMDRNMYVVSNMSSERMPLDVPNSDDLHFNTLTMGFTHNHLVSYIPDFPTKLRKVTSGTLADRYELIGSYERPFINVDSAIGDYVKTGAVAVSKDGDWMAVEIIDAGFALIDTNTREIRGFSNYRHPYGYGMDANITFIISNDGSKVAAFDYNISPVIYTLNDACTVKATKYDADFISRLQNASCSTDGGRLSQAMVQEYGSYQAARIKTATEFNTDGDTLYFDDVETDWNDWSKSKHYRTPLFAAEYKKDEGIDYIALGDSYASGEGDIEKKPDGSSYYLPGTDKNGQCHQSSRSYPYVLIGKTDLAASRMRSVACSGAQVLPDYMGRYASYIGQGQRLKDLSEVQKEATKTASLDNFVPGNVPQIDFVEKYHPKTITVMGGGNDVGFSLILEYCATPTWEGSLLGDTCGYAVKDNPLQKLLGETIQSQYDYTLMLLRKIRQVSPDTTIYVVGYPSFISESKNALCLNSAALNSDERKMINEAITFMNTMLKDAAKSSGVKYIDIQDSLHGGRMCEGSEYVTGLNDIGIKNVINKVTQEAFHPNAKAHQKIAEAIASQGFNVGAGRNDPPLQQKISLETPAYFAGSDKTNTKQLAVTNDQATEQSQIDVHIPKKYLASYAKVQMTVFSDPVKLTAVTAEANGSLNQKVSLPNSIKPGRHILVLNSISPSGEPVQYFQFLTVTSKIPNDLDGDGITDDFDKCQFIVSWIDETTNVDICQATAASPEVGSGSMSNDDSKSRSSLKIDPHNETALVGEHDTRQTMQDASTADQQVLGANTSSMGLKHTKSVSWLSYASIGLLVSLMVILYVIVKAVRK